LATENRKRILVELFSHGVDVLFDQAINLYDPHFYQGPSSDPNSHHGDKQSAGSWKPAQQARLRRETFE